MATGETGGIGTGTGTKLNLTERLDLWREGGTDSGWIGVRSVGDGRGINDDADNNGCDSSVEIEEMDSIFTLPPPENPFHHCLKLHHYDHHHHHYHHHQKL